MMLDIVYFSNITENTHHFVKKLNWGGGVKRIPINGDFSEPLPNFYVLICPSYGLESIGHLPPQVKKFLNIKENREKCVGVIGAGNINFGPEYAYSANTVSDKLKVPLLYKFELRGTNMDVEKVRTGLEEYQAKLFENTK